MCNKEQIKDVAKKVLQNMQRADFSGDAFTEKQADVIADAISKAIAEYDKQSCNH